MITRDAKCFPVIEIPILVDTRMSERDDKKHVNPYKYTQSTDAFIKSLKTEHEWGSVTLSTITPKALSHQDQRTRDKDVAEFGARNWVRLIAYAYQL